MHRLTVRLSDQVFAALTAELPEWKKLRGPRFSLNNLCEEKLSSPVAPTQWYITTTGTANSNAYVSPMTITYTNPGEEPCQQPKKKQYRTKKKP